MHSIQGAYIPELNQVMKGFGDTKSLIQMRRLILTMNGSVLAASEYDEDVIKNLTSTINRWR